MLKAVTSLAILFLCLPVLDIGAMAASYTVYPAAGSNSTGYTDYAIKNDGEALVYGGASTGAVRMETGYFKFDLSSVPDIVTATSVEFHFFVNATNWPYWSTTPVALDPVDLSSTAALLWDDAQAEKIVGYYNYQNEGSDYATGWHSLFLGGTAVADVNAALAQDWFALGAASRDTTTTYFLEIDGHTDTNVPYMVIDDTLPPANDTCAGAVVISSVPGSNSYTGNTTLADNTYNCTASCVDGVDHIGHDVTYVVTLPGNCEICVTLNQSVMTWNGAIYMVTDCADVNGTCVAGASGWLAGGEDETFCYSDTGTETYYIIVDGRDGGEAGTFQLDVNVNCIQAPSNLTCADEGSGGVDLAWINNDNYDNVEVYEDGVLIATLAGSATSYTASPDKGYRCYYVCGVAGSDVKCSSDCCLIAGYDNVEVLWDFEADDGGFVVDGTGSWQWGEPTFGPCTGTADGNIWGTRLDSNYDDDACWLLDSGAITLSEKGGFVCFDHCYDIETGYDGGVVWFTTDDFWYYTFEPIGGTDGVITATPGCTWVAGQDGFTGDSGGWVTDCWDFTDPMWSSGRVKIRFAFGTDSSVADYSGWMIDNVTVYNNEVGGTIDCAISVTPPVGTLPLAVQFTVDVTNLLSSNKRRVNLSIDVETADGRFFPNWRNRSMSVTAGEMRTFIFNQSIPAKPGSVGINTFTLIAEDITPAPYNQPPYPPSGDTDTASCTVEGIAP